MHRGDRSLAAAALAFAIALVFQQCSRPESSTPPPPAAENMQPVVSIRELMQNIFDPFADNIFNAVATTITKDGVDEHKPTSDEDWAKVMQGAVALAEGTNLLKLHPRLAAPMDYTFDPAERGPNAPELAPADVQKKIEADPALWNRHVNELRAEAVKVIDIVKARDADKLFLAGSSLDGVCEKCHLEYWYPGDKKLFENAAQRAPLTTPKE
jgi:hypothetical protein